jgi:hypothetical protein
MRLQPNRNYISNDDVQTPVELARCIVIHFGPTGRILEPCAGDGNFLRALRDFAHRSDSVAAPIKARSSSARASDPLSLAPRRPAVRWCEIKRDRDFFAWHERVDWIITNPPWSQMRAFLQHAMKVADHVVFLVTINHLWTRARIRDIRAAGFGLREIVMVDMPHSFPQLGFQLGAVHLERNWTGAVTLTDWTEPPSPETEEQRQETKDSIAMAPHNANMKPRPAKRRRPQLQTPNVKLEAASESRERLSDEDLRLARKWIPELLRKHAA